MKARHVAERYLTHVWTAALAVALVAALFTPAVSARQDDESDGKASRGEVQTPVTVRDALAQLQRRGVGTEVVGGSPVLQGSDTFATFIQVDIGSGLAVQCGGSLIAPRLTRPSKR
jgi:hypothetical protein